MWRKKSIQRPLAANVLIADDCPETQRCLLSLLAKKAIHADLAPDKVTAEDLLEKNKYNLVFTASRLSHRQGQPAGENSCLELVTGIRTILPELPVIMLCHNNTQDTAANMQTIETAVKAIRSGCLDFLTTPLNLNKVEQLLDTLVPAHHASSCCSACENDRHPYIIVGKSQKLLSTIKLSQKAAPTSAPVLISGESGTGKELISQLIHNCSKRADGPYIRVNCAALNESLLESELFGHEKGSFTGAYTQRKGRFEMAHGGTLMLDEITETPLHFQAKLLRVIEQQSFERVGGNENVQVNVRIISTTNKNLSKLLKTSRLRSDLFYRLSTIRITVPALRERVEDLPDLVWHFVNLYAPQANRRITRLDPLMMTIFADYHWPGNIRQLRNVLITSLLLGTGQTLSLDNLAWLLDEAEPPVVPAACEHSPASCYRTPPRFASQSEAVGCKTATGQNSQPDCPKPAPLAGLPLVQIEKTAILETLQQTAGNQSKAAKILGISDKTLRQKLKQYRNERCLQPA